MVPMGVGAEGAVVPKVGSRGHHKAFATMPHWDHARKSDPSPSSAKGRAGETGPLPRRSHGPTGLNMLSHVLPPRAAHRTDFTRTKCSAYSAADPKAAFDQIEPSGSI